MKEYGERVDSTELELQYAWNAIQEGSVFKLENGSTLEVLYPGQWNVEKGPDFSGARLKIDQILISGDVELHTYPRDWKIHGHSKDKAYDKVVLHITRHPYSKKTHNFLPAIPLLVLSQDQIRSLNKQNIPLRKFNPGLCSKYLKEKSSDLLHKYFAEIGIRRLQNKALRFLSEIITIGENDALLKGIFEACGYKNNRKEFLELYRRYSSYPKELSTLQKEAVLWGESGFLNKDMLSTVDDSIKNYFSNIWKEWWKLRAEHNSEKIMWTRSNARYVNSPWRRLAGLSLILKRNNFALSNALIEFFSCGEENSKLIGRLIDFFTVSDNLLDNYLDFGLRVNKKASLVGKAKAIDIVGNVVLPFMLAYAKNMNNRNLYEKILNIWMELPVSQMNISIRISAQRWLIKESELSQIFRSFSSMQGAIYLYKNFCAFLKMDCSNCPKHECSSMLAEK